MPVSVACNPKVAQALQIRTTIAALDASEVDSWDFDVFNYTEEQLIAYVCRMFMNTGLCQVQVYTLPLTRLNKNDC